MAGRLAHIFRHPIKGIGSEELTRAELTPAGALVGDRAFALLHDAAPDADTWQPRRNFLQVASGPALARVRAKTVVEGVRLTHPEREDLVLTGGGDGQELGDWLAGLWPADRPAPARLVRAPGHGMTDIPDPFVSIGNLASLRVLSQRAGVALDMRRFRINLWLDGLDPWEEAEWADREFRIGAVPLDGIEPIVRCRAPEANPDTGNRDVNVCGLLEAGYGHTEFGLYARIAAAGFVSTDDEVTRP